MSPLVSVLLPVRRAGADLDASLASLRAQTLGDLELVLVNHGATDAESACIRRAADGAGMARLRVVDVPAAAGLARALEAGRMMCRGRYIARMDADDTAHPQRLALQAARLDGEPGLGVVACRVAFGGDPVCAAGFARYVEWTNGLLTHEDLALSRFRESPLAHPSVMFRRDVAEQHGGYRDGAFPEDYELWLRWWDAGVRFAKLPETLLTWNDPPGRLSRVHENYSRGSFYAVKAGYLARWLARHNPFHPDVVIVGAGRVTRRRVELLMEAGVRVRAWAELDVRKIGREYHGAPVIHHREVPAPDRAFVVPFVASIGAAGEIRAWLEGTGRVRGRDFIEAA